MGMERLFTHRALRHVHIDAIAAANLGLHPVQVLWSRVTSMSLFSSTATQTAGGLKTIARVQQVAQVRRSTSRLPVSPRSHPVAMRLKEIFMEGAQPMGIPGVAVQRGFYHLEMNSGYHSGWAFATRSPEHQWRVSVRDLDHAGWYAIGRCLLRGLSWSRYKCCVSSHGGV